MPAASNAPLIKSVLSNNCVSVFTSQRACIGFMTLNLRSISNLSSFLFFFKNFVTWSAYQSSSCFLRMSLNTLLTLRCSLCVMHPRQMCAVGGNRHLSISHRINKGNAKRGVSPRLTIWPCDLDLWPWKSIGFQILLRTMYVPSLVKIHWKMLILECSQECYAVKNWPGDLDLWRWKSIGFQILLRTKYVPSLVKIHWRMLILECSQGCYGRTEALLYPFATSLARG